MCLRKIELQLLQTLELSDDLTDINESDVSDVVALQSDVEYPQIFHVS